MAKRCGAVRAAAEDALDAINLYRHVQYEAGYKDSVHPRDYFMQVYHSLCGLLLMLMLVVPATVGLVGVPVVTPQIVVSPSAAQVAGLFAQLSSGELASVVCPCEAPQTTLAAVSQWSGTGEDAFCTTLREGVNQDPLGRPPPSGGVDWREIISLLENANNTNCITQQGPSSAFLANVTALISAGGGLFGGRDPTPSELSAFAQELERALCGAAFGTLPLGPNSPDVRNSPLRQPPPVAPNALINDCAASSFFPEADRNLAPPVFAQSATASNIVALQQSRAVSYFNAAARACTSLFSLQQGFAAAAAAAPLSTPAALSPESLAQAVETKWQNTLQTWAQQTASTVPGSAQEDVLARASSFSFNSLDRYLNLPPELPADSFAFSSRLPFASAYFVSQGSQYFYLTARNGDSSTRYVAMAGASRVRAVSASTGNFTARRLFGVTAGYNFNSTFERGWVPLGEDFIALLDACADGLPLFIDVHNVRPVSWDAASSPPQAQLLSPFSTIALGPGLGAANPARCLQGASLLNPMGPLSPNAQEQPVVFSAPLQCPPLITFLARLRRNSSYVNVSSSSRSVTIAELSAILTSSTSLEGLTAEQTAVLSNLTQDDLVDRTQLLSTLFMQRQGPTFTHSPLAHYAACRPALCTTTQVSERTAFMYFEDALATAGGLASSVIGLVGCVSLAAAPPPSFLPFAGSLTSRRRLPPSPPPSLDRWMLFFVSMGAARCCPRAEPSAPDSGSAKQLPVVQAFGALELARSQRVQPPPVPLPAANAGPGSGLPGQPQEWK